MRKLLAGNVDELMFLAGLCLLTAGLWAVVGQGALIAPGLALAWISCPQRRPFVKTEDSLVAKRQRAA